MLKRYRAMGTQELVVFNSDAKRGRRLRVWDRMSGDFVERVVLRETARCTVLEGAEFVVAHDATLGDVLRIRRDGNLVPTEVESRDREIESLRRELAEAKRRPRR